MNTVVKHSRPVSVVITQILMAISLVPMSLGLGFSFLRGLIVSPHNLISVRAVLIFGISFGLLFVFLVYGIGGMWKRKKIGYWLGLSFLAILIAGNIYRLGPGVYNFLTSSEKSALLQRYQSPGLMIVDLGLQSVVFILLFVLFLKLLVGKNEKPFFTS